MYNSNLMAGSLPYYEHLYFLFLCLLFCFFSHFIFWPLASFTLSHFSFFRYDSNLFFWSAPKGHHDPFPWEEKRGWELLLIIV